MIRWGERRHFPVKIHAVYVTDHRRGLRLNIVGRVQNLSQTVLVGAKVSAAVEMAFDGYCLGHHRVLKIGPIIDDLRPRIVQIHQSRYRGRPWRNREWRGFRVMTPPLKRSLQFLRIRQATVSVSLKASDWLCYRFDDQLVTVPVRWDSVLGIRVAGQAMSTRKTTLFGPRRVRVPKGDPLQVVFQKERWFRVTTQAGDAGWIDARELAIKNMRALYRKRPEPSVVKVKAIAKQVSFKIYSVRAVTYHNSLKLRSDEGLFIVDAELTNKTDKEWRCRQSPFYMDFGRHQHVKPATMGNSANVLACDRLDAGQTRRGKLYFRGRRSDIPFFVGLRSPVPKSTDVVEIDVFERARRETLLKDGLEKQDVSPSLFRLDVSQAYLIDQYPSLYSTGMVISGRIQNLTGRTLTSAELHPVLHLLKSDSAKKTCERFSSSRLQQTPPSRFTPRVDASSPWASGEWRQFLTRSLKVNRLFRDISFKKVIGMMMIRAEGPFCYGLAPKIFSSEYAWRSLFGTRVAGRGRLLKRGAMLSVLGHRNVRVNADDRFIAKYQKGHWFFIQIVGGISGWADAALLRFDDLSKLYEPEPTPPPKTEVQSPGGFRLSVRSVKELASYEGVTVAADEGLYEIKVEITNNANDRWNRCQLKKAYIDFGARSRRYPVAISDGFNCNRMAIGEKRQGSLIFKRGRYDIPFGFYFYTPMKDAIYLDLYSDKFDVLIDQLNEDALDPEPGPDDNDKDPPSRVD